MKKIFSSLAILLYLFLHRTPVIGQQVSNPSTNIPTEVKDNPPVTNWPGLYDGPYVDQNYIRTQTPDIPATSFQTLTPYRQTTEYFDGLGRPLQTVSKKAQADGYDVVQSHVYDNTGKESYQYLIYAFPTTAGSSGGYHPKLKTDIINFYNGSPGEEPYSKTIFDNSPLNRIVRTMAPGHSWVGSNRATAFSYGTNQQVIYNSQQTSFIVNGLYPQWTLPDAGALPIYSGDYDKNQLYMTASSDEDGKVTETFKDKQGKVVFKRSQLVTHPTLPTDYAYTCYVYDLAGHLRCVIPPKACVPVKELNNYNYDWNLTQDALDGLCYQYTYDERGRLATKKIPGKAVEYFVYDKRDRLVMYQDGNLRKDSKWAFTIYDAIDRPMVTGQIVNTAATRDAAENVIYNSSAYTAPSIYYYLKNYDLWHVYPATVTSSQPGEILSYTYYDDYSDASFNGFTFDNSQFPTFSLPTVVASVKAADVTGRTTGSKVRVLDPDNPGADTWLTTVNYYDDNGRVIQTQSQNLHHGVDITSNLYYFQGELYKTVIDHHNADAKKVPGASDILNEITIEKTYNRNFAVGGGNDLVGQIEESINGGPQYSLAKYYYDHLGRLATKQLNIGNTVNTYNVRGFLTSTSTMAPLGVNSKVFFDENLYYDQGFASQLYNGNIAGITWSGYHLLGGVDHKNAYGYSYDPLNRLTYAEYRKDLQTAPSTPVWDKQNYDYTVSNITYDLNGNLKSMNQRGVTTQPIDMDQLTYSYAANSNKLIKVSDGVAPANTTALPDFKDNANLATEYNYDDNGNLISEANKKISSIAYNSMNKPEKVTVDGQGTITYVYDASGARLQKKVKDLQGNTTIYDYIGNFVYKDNVLQYILNEEGRCRPVADASTLGVTKFVYDFFIKDHSDNVRSVVTATPISPDYLAKHEISSANIEQLFFDNIPAVRSAKPGSTDPDDQMAAQLVAGDPNRQVGTAIMLRVMPGDRFDISADAHYEGDYRDEGSVDAGSIVSSLISTLTGGGNYDGIPIEELPDNVRIVDQTIGNPAMAEQLNNLLHENDDPALPKAHLNYLVFNDEMQLVPQESGAVQVPLGANNGWTTIMPTPVGGATTGAVVVSQSGYILVYIDNQSIGHDVWFDNVHVEHYTSQVLEEDMYYPFGLTISEDAGTGTTPNNYKLSTKELQPEFGVNYYDFGARMQDEQIGRWFQVDPLAASYERWSPYNYTFDNPINFVDPDGKGADWVMDDTKNIRWDKDANSQATTKPGETYLGKTLTFTFNSYIDSKLWDGPNSKAPGDKLTSTLSVTGKENDAGELIGLTATKSFIVGKTPFGTARSYFPGLGDNQNKFGFSETAFKYGKLASTNLDFEQHASVSPIEQEGLALFGYQTVNVAQKLDLSLSNNKLSISASTDIFPSAILSVNGTQLFHYSQPSFVNTHGYKLDKTNPKFPQSIPLRPAPSFHLRYESN